MENNLTETLNLDIIFHKGNQQGSGMKVTEETSRMNLNHPNFRHGVAGYVYGCRCDVCREAKYQSDLAYRFKKDPNRKIGKRFFKRIRHGKNPSHPEYPHGLSGHRYGCRCDLCCQAKRDYDVNRLSKKRPNYKSRGKLKEKMIHHSGNVNHPDFPHGEFRGYRAGCRCLPCKRAKADFNLKGKGVTEPKYRKLLGMEPTHPDYPHGTVLGFTNCHCKRCKKVYYAQHAIYGGIRRESLVKAIADYSVAEVKLLRLIYLNCPQGYHVDHITPLSKGGMHHPNNLQYLPATINLRKNAREDFDYSSYAIQWQNLISEPSQTIPEGSTLKRVEKPQTLIEGHDIVGPASEDAAVLEDGTARA